MSSLLKPLAAASRSLGRARQRDGIGVVLCFDVEPDPRVFDRGEPPPWDGLERFMERLPALRERLSKLTRAPARFTWVLRMDPQIAETSGSATFLADAYGDAFAELVRSGDELGLHVHGWRWDTDDEQWIADYADPEWISHCLTTGLDAFESGFGRSCSVYRGGDHFLNAAQLSCLEARGVQVDLTVEPGQPPGGAVKGEPSRGLTPDYRGVPTTPYRASPATFPAPDPAMPTDPLLIPVFSAPGKDGRGPLFPDTTPGRFVIRLGAQMARRLPEQIAIPARTDAALGPRWDFLVHNLEHLARHGEVRFVTATAAVEQAARPRAEVARH